MINFSVLNSHYRVQETRGEFPGYSVLARNVVVNSFVVQFVNWGDDGGGSGSEHFNYLGKKRFE
jgi:hypothetical protein